MVRTSLQSTSAQAMPLNTLTQTGTLSSQPGNNDFGQIISIPRHDIYIYYLHLYANFVYSALKYKQYEGQILTNNSIIQQQLLMQQFSSTSQTALQSTSTNIRPITPIMPITPAITTNFSQTLTSMPGKEQILSSNTYLTPSLTPGTSQLQITDSDNIEKPIVAKRKIQELVEQIDPRERLEPEVEDLLLDIADEFITSVTSFACRLAKHRKSDTLEVKDLQLHLERNWNIRIPGFASDEIRSVRKPVIAAAHQQKLAAVNGARAQSTSSH
nr:10781_t:CDS:2 [Entrophospora candida]